MKKRLLLPVVVLLLAGAAQAQPWSTGTITSTDEEQREFQMNLRRPQGWNRYSYAYNNPIRYTDPDGKVVLVATRRSVYSSLNLLRSLLRRHTSKARMQTTRATRTHKPWGCRSNQRSPA